MDDLDNEIFIEYLYEKRDYYLLMLKQIQLEKLQDLTTEEHIELKKLEKDIEDNLNDSNHQISKFLIKHKT